jgi:hypothetical protein
MRERDIPDILPGGDDDADSGCIVFRILIRRIPAEPPATWGWVYTERAEHPVPTCLEGRRLETRADDRTRTERRSSARETAEAPGPMDPISRGRVGPALLREMAFRKGWK